MFSLLLVINMNIQQVIDKNRRALMHRPNVVGVGIGKRRVNGRPTDEDAIVVMVSKKEEGTAGQIPQALEGIAVEIIEVGRIKAQGRR